MDTEADVPQRPRGGEMKNELAQRRNRQVLGDIGNLEQAPNVKGKSQVEISRPLTRSLHARMLNKAQAVSTEVVVISDDSGPPDLVNNVAVDRKRGPTKRVAEASKNVIDKPICETDVIVISSDEEEEEIKVTESCTKKEVKTLTSILTARSKAASGVGIKLKDQLFNIDEADVDDELAVVEYVDDLYNFYKLTEDESRVHDYMVSQTDINSKMRAILIDWLIDVHRKFELMPETLYLTVNIVDRYLSMRNISRKLLQLVGMSSMIIACKYEEVYAPHVNDLVCLSDNAYSGTQVRVMEKEILGMLGWYLTVPTPYVFLVRYIKASVKPDLQMENMVFFLAELGILQYPAVILYCPSMIAGAAVYAARCTLNKRPFWSETLKHHTGYSEEQLRGCAKLLVAFHLAAADDNLRAVYRKFSKPDRGAVAQFTPAKALLE
ncbi:hypothetical protein UlMin_030353 [Ulmus minor]